MKYMEMIQIFLASGEDWSAQEPLDFRRESPGPALPVSAAVSELRLVLLGGSTSGKRAAGDLILGTDTSTETQHSEKRQEEVAGRRVTVVDTPDWFCSGLSEKDMRQDVGRCVRLSAPGPHAFLLVMPMKPSEGEEKRMRKKMEDIFREGCWGHTLILFTHTGRLSEKRVEELLQTGSKELRQLVEKCENRYHLLNIKDRPDDTEITQLLEKIDKMVSGNRKKFYSSETYEDAERQRTDIERRIEKEWRVLMERKEKEMKSEHEKEMERSLNKMKGEIQEKELKISELEGRITQLEKELRKEKEEEKRKELERQLEEEREKMRVAEMEKERLKDEFERQKSEIEKKHIEEMEEMTERYERDARDEAQRILMKVILPEVQEEFNILKKDFIRQKGREIENLHQDIRVKGMIINDLKQSRGVGEKSTELEKLLLEQRELERENGRMEDMLYEKDREIERMRLKLKESGISTT
ncbi:hypothetical protein AALO_G00035890 [Alosa alosa]|uniref:AIG1-type G domain-containing protein n=1 Tax=Alosa alosa TaxID=278164 RepID=A0AAV6H8F4_9TELE|nr:hypothetical protein AALO_G00035890 [Alosa alosa]